MREQARAERGIGGLIDRARLSHGVLEKLVETGMILGQKTVERSRHRLYLPSDDLCRITPARHTPGAAATTHQGVQGSGPSVIQVSEKRTQVLAACLGNGLARP
jgi:hypothetical protein